MSGHITVENITAEKVTVDEPRAPNGFPDAVVAACRGERRMITATIGRDKPKPAKWEHINTMNGLHTERLKVPGGWLYRVYPMTGLGYPQAVALVFVPFKETLK